MDVVIKKLNDIQVFLKFAYGIVPIVAGADKFTNLLTNWSEYVNPMLVGILPVSVGTFMMIVGVIEIFAGVLVFIKPHIGATVVCAWLLLIALSLLASGTYLDVAVRDIMMALGAFTLFQLSKMTGSVENK